jgi:long-chain acyl-CoA synthetase
VVPEAGTAVDIRALRRYLLDRIAPYKIPKKYFLARELPRTGLGKVRKNVLQEETLKLLEKNRTAGRAL